MSVTHVEKDPDALTLTITAAYDAPPARMWQLWADPRQLERWWGPPTYPATVVDHELVPGGQVRYFMTGPEGDTHHGWWSVRAVEAPTHLEFEDGFADDAGEPNPAMPTMVVRVVIDGAAAGGAAGETRMTIVSTFPSAEAMAQFLSMGMEEGMTEALGQVDVILAGAAARPG